MSAEDWIPNGWEHEPLRDVMDRIAADMTRRPRRFIYLAPLTPKSCRYCGRGGLYWTTHRGKFRLMYPNGDLHTCHEAMEFHARRRRAPWQHAEEHSSALESLVDEYEAGRTGPSCPDWEA